MDANLTTVLTSILQEIREARPKSVRTMYGEHKVTYGTDDNDEDFAQVEFPLDMPAECVVVIDNDTYGRVSALRFYL